MLSEDSNRFVDGKLGTMSTTSVAERDMQLMFAETAATAGLLLDKGTDNPPAGAAFASVTMPCAVLPPKILVGLTENPSAAGVTVTKPTLLALPPRPSRICAEMVNTVLAVTAGAVKTAVVPLPWIDPPSADHWYATASPFKSCATAVKFAVCALRIVSAFGVGPSMKCGATFAVDVAGKPSTWISERPAAVPSAWSIVNRTQVTVFGENVTGRTLPSDGSAPTAMRVPSLNDSVPARTFSLECGLSCRLTCATETGEGQPSWIHAPESWFEVTHSRAGSCGAPSMTPSTAFRPP